MEQPNACILASRFCEGNISENVCEFHRHRMARRTTVQCACKGKVNETLSGDSIGRNLARIYLKLMDRDVPLGICDSAGFVYCCSNATVCCVYKCGDLSVCQSCVKEHNNNRMVGHTEYMDVEDSSSDDDTFEEDSSEEMPFSMLTKRPREHSE